MTALGVVVRGGPRHALARSPLTGMTEVGALPWCSGHHHPPRYYDPVGLPLTSGGLHHWLIPPVFADEAGKTGLSSPERNRAYVPLPRTPRRPGEANVRNDSRQGSPSP